MLSTTKSFYTRRETLTVQVHCTCSYTTRTVPMDMERSTRVYPGGGPVFIFTNLCVVNPSSPITSLRDGRGTQSHQYSLVK